MENPKSYRQTEDEKEERMAEEETRDFLGMENALKDLKRAHHEVVSSLPELENNLKNIETFVLVLKNMRHMLDPGMFSSLSVIISDVIIEQIEKFEEIIGNISKTTKEVDAGI